MKNQEQRNADLYRRIQSGDTTAVERLIEENMGLVVSLADKFIGRNPAFEYLRDDLIGTGNLALVDRANYFARPHSQVMDIRKYLTTAITRAFRKECDEDSPLGPGHTVQKELRKASQTDELDLSDESGQRNVPRREDVDLDMLSTEDGQRRVDLRDEVESCCTEPLEKQIVELRVEGLSDSEIAERLDVCERTVRGRRRAIETRFNERQFALGA
jgi:RNA polymerase sigma factor (sigma-70 family)